MKLRLKVAAFASAFSLFAAAVAFPVPDAKTINTLLKQGTDAFNAGDLAQSREAFADALSVDPANLTAARDLGIVCLWLDKPAAAIKPLELASGSKTMDRSLVLAIASERLSGIAKNVSPMQVVKLLKQYLEDHQKAEGPVDEAMLNALGLALSKAEDGGIGSTNSLFAEACAFYKKLNTRLEATHSGEKRWGPQWLGSEEVAAKQKTLDEAQTTIRQDNAKLHQLASDVASAKAQKAAVPYTEGNNNMTQKADGIQKRIDKLEADQTETQTSLTAAIKTAKETRPQWGDSIPVQEIPLDPTAHPPAVAAVTTPPVTPPDATPAKPKKKVANKPAPVPPPGDADEQPAPPKPPIVVPINPSGHVTRYAVAFAIAPDLVVTPSSALTDMTSISLQMTTGTQASARIVREDKDSGLTLLKVDNAALPVLPLATELKAGPARCEGLPAVNIFQPIVQEMKSTLENTQDHWTAALEKSPRLPGGPLLVDGKVVGVEMGDRDTDPASVPIITLESLRHLVNDDAKATKVIAEPKVAVFQIVASR